MSVKDCKYSFTLRERIFIDFENKMCSVRLLGFEAKPEYHIEDDTVYVCTQACNIEGRPIGIALYLPIKESIEEFNKIMEES